MDSINDLCAVGLNNINNFVLDLKASQVIFFGRASKISLCFHRIRSMTILRSFISIWKHYWVGTLCNPIHSTDSHSPLKVQGCPIVAFAEFKVITVVMTGILFCLRPPCSAPASAAPRILQVGICPRFFVVLVLQSVRRSALQCANCQARVV